jgi:hypothetical protein
VTGARQPSIGRFVALLLVLAFVALGAISLAGQVVTNPRITGVDQPVLSASSVQVGTDANTNEKDLWTYTLPAGAMPTADRGIRFTAFGTLAANANNKTLKGYFGATQCAALSTTASGSHWEVRCIVLRTGAATQLSDGWVSIALGTQNITVATPAETLSGAVVVKVTGQNGVAAANDIVFRGAIVEALQ